TGQFSGTLTVGGLVFVSAYGSHSFQAAGAAANQVNVINTTSGTTARAAFTLSAGTTNGFLTVYSQGYTQIGLADSQAAVSLEASGAGGISIATSHASGVIRFYTTAYRGQVTASGTLDWVGAINFGNGAATLEATGVLMTTWPTTASAANANVANGDYLRLVTSLRANKHEERIISIEDARRTIMGLRGVLYKSRVDADQRDWAGFIADDAEHVNPALVSYDPQGALQSFTYDRVPAYLVPLAQDHEARLAALEARCKDA